MLIITRRVGETQFIVIDPSKLPKDGKVIEITITVLGVKGNQVRLGTQAENFVQIDREDVYRRKQLEKQQEQKNAKR